MSTTRNPQLIVQPPLNGADPLSLAAYNQNFENIRALNTLMWQIPLIAMTLTGGLWFGVSSVSKEGGLSLLRIALLGVAAVGDLLLILVLERLRHIIGEYLSWLEDAYPRGYVAATSTRWFNSSKSAKFSFQLMLGFAAAVSFVLLFQMMLTKSDTHPAKATPKAVVAWYDADAREIPDGYEGLDASDTHPELLRMIGSSKGLNILDVGSGTGRDAAALAQLRHQVTAVDPSTAMLRVGRALYPGNNARWMSDAMPALGKVTGTYDVVLLSAVWMHVPPADRRASFSRLLDLTAPGGRIYMTLRLGPGDVDRAMWSTSADEVVKLATQREAKVTDLGRKPYLLARDGISWQTLAVTRGD